jgi:hypothetical protein
MHLDDDREIPDPPEDSETEDVPEPDEEPQDDDPGFKVGGQIESIVNEEPDDQPDDPKRLEESDEGEGFGTGGNVKAPTD